MSDFEMVSQLVNKTGASFEDAKRAYEACGKDMLAAAVMLEKEQNQKQEQYSSGNTDYKGKARNAFRTAGCFFGKMFRNSLKITGKREYFSIPIIAAVIILLLTWHIALPAAFIALLCGVKFVFSGPDFAEDYPFGISFFRNNDESSSDKGFFN